MGMSQQSKQIFMYVNILVRLSSDNKYYGLFSCDLHILDLQWRSPNVLTTFCGDTLCVTFMFHDSL